MNVHITPNIELLRRLGEGGMGTVWVARHHTLQKDVAVKLMARSLVANDELRRRFTQEAASGANVKSPHVVQVFDAGIAGEHGPYIVMELLEGEDLDARLARTSTLAPEALTRVVAHVAHALDRAHALGLIHRDIKPANIFLCTDGESFVCKVLDFGVAQWRARGAPPTEMGVSLGTPTYMSPEQAAGQDDLDGRSDLYALGLVAFRALTGAPAFSRASADGLGLGMYNLPLPKPTERSARLGPAVDAWFARACARDKNERFPDGAAMSSALAKALDAPVSETHAIPSWSGEGPRTEAPTNPRNVAARLDPPGGGLAQPTPSPAASPRRVPFGPAAVIAALTLAMVWMAARWLDEGAPRNVVSLGSPGSSTSATMSSASATVEPIPIGMLVDLSGEHRGTGVALVVATQAAIHRVNEIGGIRGRPLRLIVKDDQGDTGAFLVEAARALVSTKNLRVILGPITSAQVNVVAPITQQAGVLQLTASATSPTLTTLQRPEERLLFRTVPSQTIQASALARVMECKTAAIVARDDLEGRPFADTLGKAGVRVAVTRFVEAEPRVDYGDEIRAVAQSRADCLVLSVSPKTAARYLRQASGGAHPKTTYAVSTLATEDFLMYSRADPRVPSSTSVAEGVRGVRAATRPTWRPEYAELTHLLERVDGGTAAIAQPFVTNQFDATLFAAIALEAAGPEPDATALRKAFRSIARGGTVYGPQELPQLMAAVRRGVPVDYVGASGDVEVDANGDVEGDLVTWKVDHGTIVETGRVPTLTDASSPR